ncbi:HAD family hydrolase [Neptuniibacter sp. 2_MG-2023]|uniref:HAD family hydrolase n=1 Tax=Neptuniibacter sp. 2_MG-2023 TaxID=3062671 RepID=UPI0026E257A3|nr:HAD family hydrolase [Neptuniibacter sp. 2_MG-2023]MDO6515541.1 HAD family hydrolase [Neptuniibacter sp. 2_MG-2023]
MNISQYKTFIFDCDGVILDSNKLKTSAFYHCVESYGRETADRFVQYHIANGGVSRYKKFDYFFSDILGVPVNISEKRYLLELYARIVRVGLMTCDIAPSLYALRKKTPDAVWMVASGGDQSELREIFDARNLSVLFDGGIFGSPDDKRDIVKREVSSSALMKPALLIGDSQLDHKVAKAEDIDFVFVYKWSEFSQWQAYCKENNILCIPDLVELNQNHSS